VGLRYGDSVRAYGLGIILILIALGLVWRVAREPTTRAVCSATIAGVLSVQCLYQNIFLLAGICSGAVLVGFRQRGWRQAARLAVIGGMAAISLVPYRGSYLKAQESIDTSYTPVDVQRLVETVTATLATPSAVMLWLWVVFLALGIGSVAWGLRHRRTPTAGDRVDLALFSLTTILAAVPLQGALLVLSSFHINPWHYVVSMALVAACLDAIFAATVRRPEARLSLALIVLGAAALVVAEIGPHLRVRHTNVDLIAARLASVAAPGDLIVVSPWVTGITFHRYYRGAAAWTTLPPLDDVRVHRHDLLKQAMRDPDPIRSVLDRVADTLKADGRVWLVLQHSTLARRGEPPPPPPVPHPVWRWHSGLHIVSWEWRVWHYVANHAANAELVAVPTAGPVSPLEDMKLVRAGGLQ
jgi:hypothetical protein